jgi:LacI family transcriptional regulator
MINTTTAYGREVIRGIARYAREQGPWMLLLEPLGFGLPRYVVAGLKTHGVIAQIADVSTRNRVRRWCHVPVVDVSEAFANLPYPKVLADPLLIARAAVEHLHACGFRRFAFCGFESQPYSHIREQAFLVALDEQGFTCDVYRGGDDRSMRSFQAELRRLSRWVANFDQPTGVFACNDWRGQHVLQSCLLADIAVPNHIGVVGADNDEVVRETCPISLTSIDIGMETIGYQAAELLDRLMRGQPAPAQPELVGNVHVIARRSTDVLLVDDPLIRKALAIIRASETPPRCVEDVLRELPLSRRPFEKRFRKAVGRSPYEEIQACRVQLAKRLLRTTDLPIGRIAERCGFALPHHLSAAFRRATGLTPIAYRRR